MEMATLFLSIIAIESGRLDILLRRHADARKAIMQVYVVAETYDVEKETLLFRRRFAVAPERSRLEEFTTSSLLKLDPSLKFRKQVIDYYADGKHCFFLQVRNKDAFPKSLPPGQADQRRMFSFVGHRSDYHPKGAPAQEVLDVRALRKLTSLCLRNSGKPNYYYLEELIPRCEKVRLLDDFTLELLLSSQEGDVRRERIEVQLDPQQDYAIREIRVHAWDVHGKQIADIRFTVSKFVRINGVSWPARVDRVARSSGTVRKRYTKFSRIVINRPLPPEAFNFRIPENAVIPHYDPVTMQTTRVLIYGKNNQVVRTFTPEEYRQYLRKQAGLPPEPQTPKEKTFWPLVATLALLALALGLALLWRRTGRTAPPGKALENREDPAE